MSLRPLWPVACLATLLSSLIVGCTEPPEPEQPSAEPVWVSGALQFPAGHPHLSLLSTSVAQAAGTRSLDLPARLVWDEQRTQRVIPSFAGRVTALAADVGQTVQPGTVLARLQSPDFGAAQADLAKARADVELINKTLERQRQLLDVGVLPRKDLEQSEAEATRARAELARAQARVALYGGGSTVNQELALRSGLAGMVVERHLNPGQELRPDSFGPDTPPLFVISDPTQLWVLIDAPETAVSGLRPGQSFELIVPTLPGESMSGQLMVIADVIDPSTRTVKLRGRIANPLRHLRAEMLGTARFRRHSESGVTVPAAAVLLQGGQHYVYVRHDARTFEPREVSPSFQGPSEAVIAQGLKPGEEVVSQNLLLLARQSAEAQDEAPKTLEPAHAAPAAPQAEPAARAKP